MPKKSKTTIPEQPTEQPQPAAALVLTLAYTPRNRDLYRLCKTRMQHKMTAPYEGDNYNVESAIYNRVTNQFEIVLLPIE